MRLIIAEKPSLARMIADALGITKVETAGKMKNYVCGNDMVIAAVGHVFEWKLIEDYVPEYKSWSKGKYPFMPEKWEYKKKDSVKDVIKNIETQLKRSDSVVNAGDADREGQLLIDEILEYYDYKKPVFRLLINDTNPEAIRESFKRMKPNSEHAGLSRAGKARSMADWLLGMNMSRVCTLKAQSNGFDGVLSVGRVQTPLVGLVVRRDREIRDFKAKDYYVPTLTLEASDGTKFSCRWKLGDEQQGMDDEGRLVDPSAKTALEEKIRSAISSGAHAMVVSAEKKPGKKSPPMPHSLPTLQIEASEKLGLSPSDTLQLVQQMYESGIVTYPRSDCAYLPESAHSDAQKILTGAAALSSDVSKNVGGADLSIKSDAFDDAEVQEHYAIIPTGKRGELTPQQKKVFDLIATRFTLQFYSDHEYLETKGEISFAGELFRVSGRETVKDGWRAIYESDDKKGNDDDEGSASVPKISKGDALKTTSLDVKAKKTTPPKPFTDATLLKAMNAIHTFVTDPKIKKVLRDTDGLGTAATQAAHIDNILKRGYVVRDGKKIVSTERGQKLIDALPTELTTPDRTALWEVEMGHIADGHMALDIFIDGVFKELTHLTDGVRQSEGFKFQGGAGGTSEHQCPICKGSLRRIRRKDGGYFWACQDQRCKKTFDDAKGKPKLTKETK